MKIFLSWSGRKSEKLASGLHEFLERLGFEPWMSKVDIKAGQNWSAAITNALRSSDVCIACMTHESLHSQWLHFEAGAIPTSFALLWDLEIEKLTGPLANSQPIRFERNEMLTLINELNQKAGPGLDAAKLKLCFNKHWHELEEFDKDPLEQLFRSENVETASYLLGQASRMKQATPNEKEQRTALRELVAKIKSLMSEDQYLALAARLIRDNSVWAVCGRKTEKAWSEFLEANEFSRKKGRRIERVFFPPEPEERELICRIIKRHFENDMIVYGFPSRMPAQKVYGEWHLPNGFGMSLIGKRNPDTDAEMPALEAALVHWGGVGSGDAPPHYGVILDSPAWLEHFWGLRNRIHTIAEEIDEDDLCGDNRNERFRSYWFSCE